MLHQLARAFRTSPAVVGAVAEEYNVDDGESICGMTLTHHPALSLSMPASSLSAPASAEAALSPNPLSHHICAAIGFTTAVQAKWCNRSMPVWLGWGAMLLVPRAVGLHHSMLAALAWAQALLGCVMLLACGCLMQHSGGQRNVICQRSSCAAHRAQSPDSGCRSWLFFGRAVLLALLFCRAVLNYLLSWWKKGVLSCPALSARPQRFPRLPCRCCFASFTLAGMYMVWHQCTAHSSQLRGACCTLPALPSPLSSSEHQQLCSLLCRGGTAADEGGADPLSAAQPSLCLRQAEAGHSAGQTGPQLLPAVQGLRMLHAQRRQPQVRLCMQVADWSTHSNMLMVLLFLQYATSSSCLQPIMRCKSQPSPRGLHGRCLRRKF